MNEKEIFKDENEILSHFENLKTGLIKALKMESFKILMKQPK